MFFFRKKVEDVFFFAAVIFWSLTTSVQFVHVIRPKIFFFTKEKKSTAKNRDQRHMAQKEENDTIRRHDVLAYFKYRASVKEGEAPELTLYEQTCKMRGVMPFDPIAVEWLIKRYGGCEKCMLHENEEERPPWEKRLRAVYWEIDFD